MKALPPDLIGRRTYSLDDVLRTSLEARAESMAKGKGAGFYPGLFESSEDEGTYMLRRRWFHAKVTGGNEDMASDTREAKTRRTRELNEFGHSEDREEYRQRREWYHQAALAQDQARDILFSVSVQAEDVNVALPVSTQDARADVQAWCTLARAICIMILSLSVWFSSNSFVAEIAEEYGVGKRQATLLTVFVNLGFTVGASCSAVAQLPDFVAPSSLLLIGCLGCASSGALLASGLPFAVLVLARFLNGIALAFVYPVLMRFIAGWFPPAQRGFSLGLVIGSLTVGIALPSLLKATLPSASWKTMALGTASLALIASVLTCGIKDGPFAQRVAGFSYKNVFVIFRTWNWHWVTASYMAHNIELFGGWAWMGAFLESYFNDRAGGDAGATGKAAASAGAFAVVAIGSLGAAVGGFAADYIGKRRCITSMHVLSGLMIAILPSAADVLPPPGVFLIAGIWGMTAIADSAQYSALLAEVLPEKRLLGTAITMSLGLGFISTAVGIYAVPLLFESLGWEGAFPCLAIGPLVGIITIWAVRPLGVASK